MDRAFFVKDCWWRNTNTDKKDPSNNISSESNRICHHLNQNSGYVQFELANSTPVSFESVLSHNTTVPDQIYTEISFISGYTGDFNFNIKVNDVNILNGNIPVSTTYQLVDGFYESKASGYFTPTQAQYSELMRNKFKDYSNKISEDSCEIIISQPGASPNNIKVRNISINYIGESLYRSYNSLTPDIKKFYPNQVYSEYQLTSTNPTNVKGPTDDPVNDSTFISGYTNNYTNISGKSIFSNYIDFYFSTSGLFNYPDNSKKIDKCIFSIRYQNKSGDLSNHQNWASVSLLSNNPNAPEDILKTNIGYGSGFHINNSNSFKIAKTDITFLDQARPVDNKNTTDLVQDFIIRLHGVPKSVAISSCETDFYLSSDKSLLMHLPGQVFHRRAEKTPNDSTSNNFGNNRLRDASYDSLNFNVEYFDFHKNDNLDKNFSPLFWKNYYEEKINTYQFHDHDYKNALLLNSGNYIYTNNFDSTNSNYSIYLHISTSGNYDYFNTLDGSNILSRGSGNNLEFDLKFSNNNFLFSAYRTDGSVFSESFDATYDNRIFITKEIQGSLANIKVYKRDISNNINNLVFDNLEEFREFNNNFVIGDFTGYIHEFGVSDKFLDVDEFYSSRENISKSLSENGLRFDLRNVSGLINEDFTINYKQELIDHPTLYHYASPMVFAYNTLLTNPSSISLLINYTNNATKPSGINFSGYYYSGFRKNGYNDAIKVDFISTFPSGTGSVEIFPSSYSPVYSALPENTNNYLPFLRFNLNSNSVNDSYDLKINSIDVSFDGWFVPQTGIQTLNFATRGYQFESNNLDFYLHNKMSTSGLDFYTRAKEVVNEYINYTTIGSVYNTNSVNFVTNSKVFQDANLDFYVRTPLEVSESINFQVNGRQNAFDVESVNFFIQSVGYNQTIDYALAYYGVYGFPYYGQTGNSGIYNGFNFVTYSDFDDHGSINFYISSLEDETEDSINLSIKAGNDFEKNFNMIVMNEHFENNYQLDFTLPSAYNQSGIINMSVKG